MVWEFVIPLILFVYLYGRILLFVRQRNQAFNGTYTNQAMATSLQTNAHRSQMNVTVTMIIVSSAFVLCWLPNQLFYLLSFIDNAYYIDVVYYATVFLIFLNVCTNPLIYAAKHEEVKNRLKKWFFKTKVQPEVSTVAGTISECCFKNSAFESASFTDWDISRLIFLSLSDILLMLVGRLIKSKTIICSVVTVIT